MRRGSALVQHPILYGMIIWQALNIKMIRADASQYGPKKKRKERKKRNMAQLTVLFLLFFSSSMDGRSTNYFRINFSTFQPTHYIYIHSIVQVLLLILMKVLILDCTNWERTDAKAIELCISTKRVGAKKQ